MGWVTTAAPVNAFSGDLLGTLTDWAAGLPNQQLSDFLAGALSLLRRNLFDQEPVASPVQAGVSESGQITGSIGAFDPEGETVIYRVVVDPTFGSVEVSGDGEYTYTPGPRYAGSDNFTVRITDTTDGFNLLAVGDDGSSDVNVLVGAGASTNPFGAENLHDASLFLGDTPATVTVVKQQGVLVGTVAMSIADTTSLLWLDEQGRIGSISAADVVRQWDGIANAGNVRLGLGFTLDDGSQAALIMNSVQATSVGTDQYLFTGALVPNVADAPGVNNFWDVIGGSYKSSYENFLRESEAGAMTFTSFSQMTDHADLYLDTYNVADYKEELATGDPGQPMNSDSDVSGGAAIRQAAASQSSSAGAFFDEITVRAAIDYAQSKQEVTGPYDPVFSSLPFMPACKIKRNCDGSIYSMNFSYPKTQLASYTQTFADPNQSAKLSLDFWETSYGYVYVPSGVWAKLDSDQYSFGFMLALTAGPSFELNLGGKGGKDLNIKSVDLKGPSFSSPPSALGMLQVSTALKAALTANIELPKDFTGDKLTASAYATGAYVLAYNTSAGSWNTASNFYLEKNTKDFEQVTSATITASVTPSIAARWGLFTPDISWLPTLTVVDAVLTYSNPLDATLTVAKGSTSLTVGASGDLSFSASFLPKFSSLTYSPDKINLYTVRSQNLL